jgi:peptide-methionine (S)-S-oxide reductase
VKKIVLAAGCFWGLEAYLQKYDGILNTEVGYANGIIENPTYEQVKTGGTGHAEVCHVTYDPDIMPLEKLMVKFWQVIDPTVLNRQGPDIGHQYRTGIYYTDSEDLDTIMASRIKEQEKYDKSIVTEIEPLKCYYPAEDYHQNYLTKNPNGYCHIDLSLYD